MSRIFTRKQFSNYLGENRAIDDIITSYYLPTDTSIRYIWDSPDSTNTGSTLYSYMWYVETDVVDPNSTARWAIWNNANFTPDYGGGVIFDGLNNFGGFTTSLPTGDPYDTTGSLLPLTGPFTISWWWEPYDTYAGHNLLLSISGNFSNPNPLRISCENMKVSFYTMADGWNEFTASAMTINQPYHLTFTYDGDTDLKYYINGELQDTLPADIDLSVVSNTWLGGDVGELWYECAFYRMWVYDEVKNDSFILTQFDTTKSQYGY